MIALRAALAVLALSSLVGSALTARHDGAWLIGVIAAVALAATFGVFSRAFWSAPEPDEDALFAPLRPEPKWEAALAFVVSPLLFVLAVMLLVRVVMIS